MGDFIVSHMMPGALSGEVNVGRASTLDEAKGMCPAPVRQAGTEAWQTDMLHDGRWSIQRSTAGMLRDRINRLTCEG